MILRLFTPRQCSQLSVLGLFRGFSCRFFTGGGLFGGGGFFLAGFEFESDLAVFDFEIGGEGAAFFGDETRDEIGLADGEDFFDLLARDFFLAKGFSHAEFAFADI